MVFVEGDDYRQLRRPGDDPAQFRSVVRLPRGGVPNSAVVDELSAWYRFEDSSNTAIDYTAVFDDDRFADTTSFNATVNGSTHVTNGGVTDVLSGANSGAYRHDGVDDFIKANSQPVDSTTDFTVCVWVNPQDTDNGRILNTNDTENGFRVQYENGRLASDFGLVGFEDSGNRDGFTSGPTVPVGSFTHIAITLNTITGEAKLYTNGALRETITTSGSGGDPQTLEIGAAASFGTAFFNGITDDVRVFERTVNGAEISQIVSNTEPL
jgi:hypothetical protein